MTTLMMTVLIVCVAVTGGGAMVGAGWQYFELPDRRPDQLIPATWVLGTTAVILFVLTIFVKTWLIIAGF